MTAYPLVRNNPQKYKNHIILIGTFHLVCAYVKMVGKKMAGSGLSDVLLEAGLTGSGSIQGVLRGKHYERAMHCHKAVLESLERLVLEQFPDEREENIFEKLSESSTSKLQDLIQNPLMENLEQLSNDQAISHYFKDYIAYRKNIEDGKLGKTGQFWMQYMNDIWLVLALIQAVKTNNFLLYAECLDKMADLFFSFNGHIMQNTLPSSLYLWPILIHHTLERGNC